MSPNQRNPSVDLVIPVFNEAGVVEQTHARICAVIEALPYNFTIYYVDDGSTDATIGSLESLKDTRVQVLALSRNFGHQAALTAGMDASQGDIVITMDGDGQHPPEMIPQMIDLVRQGYDVVQTQRVD
jgi:polyisoprenyl-phosphate glycosyltransferase